MVLYKVVARHEIVPKNGETVSVLLFVVAGGGLRFASRFPAARLGLTTASRFCLLAKYRSGVQILEEMTLVISSPAQTLSEIKTSSGDDIFISECCGGRI